MLNGSVWFRYILDETKLIYKGMPMLTIIINMRDDETKLKWNGSSKMCFVLTRSTANIFMYRNRNDKIPIFI